MDLKRTVLWDKYRSEMTTQLRYNNLDYLIDSTFKNNRLFVLSFKNVVMMILREIILISINYYMTLIEIKYFNVLIDKKPFFDQLIKNKQEAHEKLVEI